MAVREEPGGHGVGEGEGGQRQVEVAQPDGGQSDERTDRGTDHGARHQPEEEPPPATLPITKAPMPMKENWHSETWPEYPVSSTRESPTMPSVMTMPPKVEQRWSP